MAVNPIKVWNGTAWEYTGPVVAAPPVKYQATAPTSPATGDVWVESDYDVASVDPSKLLTGGVYTNESTRSAAIPTPTTGMVTYVGDTGTDPSTIPQLEAYTGSAWQNLGGLTLLANVPVSASASVTIDNIFSSLYGNYLLTYEGTGTSLTNLVCKYRTSGGADTSDSTYGNIMFNVNSANTNLNRVLVNASSTLYMGSVGDTGTIISNVISRPFLSVPTSSTTQWSVRHSTLEIETGFWGCVHAQSTSYTGIKISPGAGTMTGTFKVYGLRNS
jgi:hypothetical protein